ncbi:MAG: TatD family hydrolase, partial [Methanomicrobium sp.]|nr:TatD family hydrolase [Methanomicrobium sp.]
ATDDHIHINIVNGRGIEAAKDFNRAGGTHMFLVTLPSWSFGITPTCGEDFRAVFEINLKTSKLINEEEICAYPVMGVHPAELTKLAEIMPLSRAEEIIKDGLSIAAEYVIDKKAVALKSGRPHYPVEDEILEASNRILRHALELSKDCDCALQIHAESGPCTDVYDLAKEMNIKPYRVVKHFATPDTPLTPSMIAKHEDIPKLAKEMREFTMESDYMDDLSRPGSVIGPKSVPRFTKRLLMAGAITEEDAFRIHKETPEKVYGVEIKI